MKTIIFLLMLFLAAQTSFAETVKERLRRAQMEEEARQVDSSQSNLETREAAKGVDAAKEEFAPGQAFSRSEFYRVIQEVFTSVSADSREEDVIKKIDESSYNPKIKQKFKEFTRAHYERFQKEEEVQKVVDRWFNLIDHEQYDESWKMLSSDFKKRVDEARWQEDSKKLKEGAGNLISRRTVSRGMMDGFSYGNKIPYGQALFEVMADYEKGGGMQTVALRNFGGNWEIVDYIIADIPYLFKAKISANDVFAKVTLGSLSNAWTSYARSNSGNYPDDITSLTGATPPYLNTNYCGQTIAGYTFECSFDAKSYRFTATPVEVGASGTTTYTISTGGVYHPYIGY